MFLQRAFIVAIATILQLQQPRCPVVLARAHERAFLSLDSGPPGATQEPTAFGTMTVQVRSGAQLASALADTSVQVAVVPIDMVLSAADWASQPVPVVLNRNFTILGAYEDQRSWPLLDLSFLRARVQLCPGMVLRFSRVVIRRYRAAPQFQAQGIDLLVSSNQSITGPRTPLVIIQDATIVHRICMPSTEMLASSASTPRPAEIPGTNEGAKSLPPFPGCINSSSIPPMQRCWAGAGFFTDGALYATDLDMYGKPARSGYLVRLLRTFYLCDAMMSDECVQQLGPVGCYWRMAASSPEGMFPDGNSTSMFRPAVSTSGFDGKKALRSTLLTALLAGLLGGSVIVLMLALILRFVKLQRRRCSDEALPAANYGGACGSDTVLHGGEARTVASENGFQGGQHWPRYVLREAPANGSGEQGGANDFGSEVVPSGCLDSPRLCRGANEFGFDGVTSGTDSGRLCAVEVQLVPVTLLTPVSPDVNLRLELGDTAAPDDDTPGGSSNNDDGVQLLGNVLGRGAIGRVVMGRYRGELVAVKMLNAGLAGLTEKGISPELDRLPAQGSSHAAGGDAFQQRSDVAGAAAAGGPDKRVQLACQTLAQEVEVLARCDHPNIVRLLAASLKPPRVCLVMELMETSLARMLHGGGAANGGHLLPLSTVLHIATQIARALAYLHPTILHRDLKPANVLVLQAASAQPVAKLADFGISRFRMATLLTRNPEAGTVPYMAPETFEVTNYVITDRADVYSFGVLLWEMLTGTRPWAGSTDVQVAAAVALHGTRLPLDETLLPASRCPPKLRALIRACWERDPARRPAAAEIVKCLALVQEGLVLRRKP